MTQGAAWHAVADGLVLSVRVTPRATARRLAGGTDALFAARVTAPPAEGAANAALVRLIADAFALPRRDVAIVAGAAARIKRVRLSGDPQVLAQAAQRLYADGHDG